MTEPKRGDDTGGAEFILVLAVIACIGFSLYWFGHMLTTQDGRISIVLTICGACLGGALFGGRKS